MNKFPKIKLSNHENVALMFMEAITKYSTEDAKKYISRNFVSTMDFVELKDFFVENNKYKVVDKIDFDNRKNFITKSIVFFGEDKKNMNLINIHMINEPDRYSKWKIFAFDKEDIRF